MSSQLLLGASVAVVAVGLSGAVLFSTRGPVPDGKPGPVLAFEGTTHAGEEAGEAERTGEAGFLGVVVALQSVELSARFDGTLERLDVHVGDRVRRGTPIARLEDRSVARDLAMAEASLRVAEAEHDRLVIELEDAADRRERLHRIPDLVAREQLTAANSQEQVAAARLRGSEADLAGKRERADQLREMLRDAQIVAPFDGTIAARYVDPGATVSRSAPIVRVISPASLVIRFAVPEEQAAEIALGREVIVRVASMDATMGAVIESIAPEIDAALRMVVVEARLAGTGRTDTIQSGAVARVLLREDTSQQGQRPALVNPLISAGDGSTGHGRSVH
jgi:RND family efflux transporter MFP subunit